MHNKAVDVTDEYIVNSMVNNGEIIYDDNFKKELSHEEVIVAKYIHQVLGGDIKLLWHKNYCDEGSPDYVWNGRLWELKTPSELSNVPWQTRKAISQISKTLHGTMQDKQGGIIFDCVNMDDVQRVIDKVIEDISDPRSKYITGDIFFLKDGKFIVIHPIK